MVSVQSISHQFDKRLVLEDISFDVPEGQILAIMGSSGGGKTTLLKCISGLLKPSKGDVEIDGVSVVKSPEKAREHLGLVFQYAALFDYLNVRDNILFGLERRKRLSKKDRDETVGRLLEAVALDPETATQLPNELSGGMRKRVGLARALATEPSVLLYDEPTSGLDPVTAYSIDRLIVDTRDRTGVTSIVVSHDVNSVFRVADRIAFLAAGKLVFFGTRAEFESTNVEEIMDLVHKAKAQEISIP